jgi:hypothetical protein
MAYEINVSLNGSHYFATHERSLRDSEKAVAMAQHFQKLFPASAGYEVTLAHYTHAGTVVAIPKGDPKC